MKIPYLFLSVLASMAMAAPVVPSEASKDAVERRQRFPELCGACVNGSKICHF
ncbi:hypothetical protein D7B24_007840 [Verticillium nonalfalfae]|uniref:Uncharacterized protein n=1 Tax=Verticillium nonalfalfae TaxID=1051616 RepID=A0A3M9Y652_9PEZI|nr:uncharacterized protein D7B24_007840 [Verticillium nonalfalfae]RNJ55947.1 hypothetical protein D7B24_007840 [Verticillium nonalfalfae]